MQRFTKYHFTGQKEGEEIFLVLHRHWFDILSQFFMIFIMLSLLIGGYLSIPFVFPDYQDAPLRGLFDFLTNLFFILLWIISFMIWFDYYLDVWIVTDRRIVNIEQKGLFGRVVSELELKNIQDITTDVKGVIPTFFNYGNLYVQTAAQKERFIFRNIPNPYAVKDKVMNVRKDFFKKNKLPVHSA